MRDCFWCEGIGNAPDEAPLCAECVADGIDWYDDVMPRIVFEQRHEKRFDRAKQRGPRLERQKPHTKPNLEPKTRNCAKPLEAGRLYCNMPPGHAGPCTMTFYDDERADSEERMRLLRVEADILASQVVAARGERDEAKRIAAAALFCLQNLAEGSCSSCLGSGVLVIGTSVGVTTPAAAPGLVTTRCHACTKRDGTHKVAK